MSRRASAHLRHSAIAYLALFLALTMGTAYATHPGGQNTISTDDLQNRAVTTPKLADGAVNNAKIEELTIRENRIRGSAVTTPKIDTQAVVTGKLADLAVTNAKLANNSVDSAKVANGALTAADVTANTFWTTAGNAGTDPASQFLGTTDNTPLNFRVNNARALRLEPAENQFGQPAPNVIGGFAGNNVTAGVGGATISGGGHLGGPNRVTGRFGTVGGGTLNRAGTTDGFAGDEATVGGGSVNTASGINSTVGGGSHNTASGFISAVAGGGSNAATAHRSAVAGGQFNTASGDESAVAGGRFNTASGKLATIGGGGGDMLDAGNVANGSASTVGGGRKNSATDEYGTVGGGNNNRAGDAAGTTSDRPGATVAGGESNAASGSYATVAGGRNNFAAAFMSSVTGGENNLAAGLYSSAAGRRAKADHSGSFVWADGNDFDFRSSASNQLRARTTGGAQFVTAIDGSGNATAGVALAAGGSAWGALSDAASKENVEPVSGREVLRKLASIPVSTWSYKAQDDSIRHIGPMAQDFYEAFGVGEDPRRITTIDADGVALAAVQGLNERLERENTRLRRALGEHEARLARLERALHR